MPNNPNLPASGLLYNDKNPTELSFSGADVLLYASINNGITTNRYELGAIETISISTHRDTAPVRVIGQDAPVAYRGGTRTVSGTMIFSKVYNGAFEQMILENNLFAVGDIKGIQSPDRMPPFHIQLHVATEYSDAARVAHLRDITIMDSGQTVSIHDVYTEQSYSYVAREFIDFVENSELEIGAAKDQRNLTTLTSIYNNLWG